MTRILTLNFQKCNHYFHTGKLVMEYNLWYSITKSAERRLFMELLQGRPADISGRLEKEIRVYDFLDSLGIFYDRIDHEPAMTMDVCVEIDAALGASMCKNLFLCNRQKTVFYLLLIPGGKRFKTSVVSKLIGSSRLSFGEPDKLYELLGVHPGSPCRRCARGRLLQMA